MINSEYKRNVNNLYDVMKRSEEKRREAKKSKEKRNEDKS